MGDALHEHRRALLGGALALVVGPVLGSVLAGWESAMSVLKFVMATFAALLVLKAASVLVVLLVRSVL